MGLLRTILALVVTLIMVHVVLYYLDIAAGTNSITRAIFSLGALVEAPATIILGLLISVRPDFMDPGNFYVVAITAIVAYSILYLLLGIGRD